MGELPQTRYEKYLKSVHWKRKREQRIFFAMQAYPPLLPRTVRCNGCERFVWLGRIHVHHKTYENLGNEKIADLAVLCEGCHAKEHGLELPYWYIKAGETNEKICTKEFIMQNRTQTMFTLGDLLESVIALHPVEENAAIEDANRQKLLEVK